MVAVIIQAVSPLLMVGVGAASAADAASGAAATAGATTASTADAISGADAATSWAWATPSRPKAASPSANDAMSFLMKCLLIEQMV